MTAPLSISASSISRYFLMSQMSFYRMHELISQSVHELPHNHQYESWTHVYEYSGNKCQSRHLEYLHLQYGLPGIRAALGNKILIWDIIRFSSIKDKFPHAAMCTIDLSKIRSRAPFPAGRIHFYCLTYRLLDLHLGRRKDLV